MIDENNNSQPILLTISILVSGRDTTRRCLDSLKKLRERVPCELILTDTGCTEEMKGWLKEYADKIIPFTWCNDFAAARNAGLRQASGKWFLYMDDDEWFEDTSEIEEFFLSGEYKRFHSALYKVRNYGDRQGVSYQDSYVSRMSEMMEGSQFVYPIHEILLPGTEPVKYLEDYVHHFGYAYVTEEERRKKNERNLPLLQKLHRQEKHNIRHNVQLILEYNDAGEYGKALEVAYEGIRDYDQSFPTNIKMLNACYAYVVRSLINMGRYEQAYEEAQRFTQSDHIIALGMATIVGEATYACLRLGQIDKGLLYLRQYKRLQDVFEKEVQHYQEQQTAILENCFEFRHYQWVMMVGIQLAAAAGSEKRLKEVFQMEPLEWWEEAVHAWIVQIPSAAAKRTRETFRRGMRKNPYLAFLCMNATEAILLKGIAYEENGASISNMLDSYTEAALEYYKDMYSPRFISDYHDMLPGRYLMAEGLSRAGIRLADSDYTGALKECRAVISSYPALSEAVRLYARNIAEIQGKSSGDEMRDNLEFQLLARRIKVEIRDRIEAGLPDEAEVILSQLKSLIPEDEDLEVFEDLIYEMKNRGTVS